MKTLFQILITFALTLFITDAATAQKKIQTDTLTVAGVCEMCEKRIENAAFVKGVKLAEWNKNAQQLTVIYKTKKTDLDKIATAVANAGHDNSKKKAPKEAYAELPDCCAYRDGVKVH